MQGRRTNKEHFKRVYYVSHNARVHEDSAYVRDALKRYTRAKDFGDSATRELIVSYHPRVITFRITTTNGLTRVPGQTKFLPPRDCGCARTSSAVKLPRKTARSRIARHADESR